MLRLRILRLKMLRLNDLRLNDYIQLRITKFGLLPVTLNPYLHSHFQIFKFPNSHIHFTQNKIIYCVFPNRGTLKKPCFDRPILRLLEKTDVYSKKPTFNK